MKFFQRRARISRPVQAPVPVGNTQFAGTSVYVRPAVIPLTGGDFAATTLQHLNEIQSFLIGQQFLAALTALGKRQVVQYGGPGGNQAAGPGLGGYKLLRRYHDNGEHVQFAAELQATLTASGHDKRWLADQLYKTDLPRWSGNTTPGPFRNPLRPPPVPPRPGHAKPLPPTPVDLIERQIDRWLAGTELPDRDEMDIVMLVLEQWLNNGPGGNTLISYDPHKTVVAGMSRPPHVALFHELVHAYYNATGGQLGREDSIQETNGGRLFELMAVGLPPFDARPYGENQFRTALGVNLRQQYP